MEKEFVPYEQALALKELGLDEPCILLYRGLDTQPVCQMGYKLKTERNSDVYDETNYWLTVPTFSQAFRWFREKHGLIGLIEIGTQEFSYQVFNDKGNRQLGTDPLKYNGTYEESELECLKKLIEITESK